MSQGVPWYNRILFRSEDMDLSRIEWNQRQKSWNDWRTYESDNSPIWIRAIHFSEEFTEKWIKYPWILAVTPHWSRSFEFVSAHSIWYTTRYQSNLDLNQICDWNRKSNLQCALKYNETLGGMVYMDLNYFPSKSKSNSFVQHTRHTQQLRYVNGVR